jgi:arsenical pump membrane protein
MALILLRSGMLAVIIISALTSFLIILSIIFFPVAKIRHFMFNTYWVIALTGAIVVLASGLIDIKDVAAGLFADFSINPVKLLVLFISMAVLSIFLDELGFFGYVAYYALKKSGTSGLRFFVYFYLLISLLTLFTSNDVIILTFTPFICYFAKSAKINPVAFLIAELTAANTWSMGLIVGNPTNIYIATASGVGFVEYLTVMAVPTVLCGAVSFFLLFLIFRKTLKKPLEKDCEPVQIKDKKLMWAGLIHLFCCFAMLVASSYINIEMWLISLAFAGSLMLTAAVYCIIKKRRPAEIVACARRAPWEFVPFIISMFIIVLAVEKYGITQIIAEFLSGGGTVLKYGGLSFLSSNIINNIPMSVLFEAVIRNLSGIERARAIYASIIGSNLGALLTPIGALAGLMWVSLLKNNGVKFSARAYVKYGCLISIPALASSLLGLGIMLGF